MKKSFNEFMQGILESETKEVRVGRVSPAFAKRLSNVEKAHDAMHEEIESKIEAYAEKLKAEHESDCEAFSIEAGLVWEKVFDALDLSPTDRQLDYSIDLIGVVSRVEGFDDDDEQMLRESNQVH